MNRLKEIILQKEKANTGNKKVKAKPQRVSQSDPSDGALETPISMDPTFNEAGIRTAPDAENGKAPDDAPSSTLPLEVSPTDQRDESSAVKDTSRNSNDVLDADNDS